MLHFVLIENSRLSNNMVHVRSFERDRLNERLHARVGRSGVAPAWNGVSIWSVAILILEVERRPQLQRSFHHYIQRQVFEMAAINLDAVNAKLDGASAEESIQYAVDTFGDGVAVTTSFGVQSAMMLHLATSIKPDIRIIWIDTGYLPKETYEFARDLTQRLDLNLHVYTPDLTPARIEALLGEKLWERDHKAYGKLTKVVPMAPVAPNTITFVDAFIVVF